MAQTPEERQEALMQLAQKVGMVAAELFLDMFERQVPYASAENKINDQPIKVAIAVGDIAEALARWENENPDMKSIEDIITPHLSEEDHHGGTEPEPEAGE